MKPIGASDDQPVQDAASIFEQVIIRFRIFTKSCSDQGDETVDFIAFYATF